MNSFCDTQTPETSSPSYASKRSQSWLSRRTPGHQNLGPSWASPSCGWSEPQARPLWATVAGLVPPKLHLASKTPPKTHDQGAPCRRSLTIAPAASMSWMMAVAGSFHYQISLSSEQVPSASSLLPVWLSLKRAPSQAPSPTPASDLSPRKRNPLPEWRLL